MKKKQDSAPPMPSSMPMGQAGRPAAPALPDTATLFAHATASHQAGNLQQAAMLYRMVLTAQPRHAEALTNLGAIYLKNGELGMAGQLIETSLSINPDQTHAYINLGIILQLLKRFDEALAAYGRAISLKPDLADAYNNQGNVLRSMKRFDEALASFDRAIALAPHYADACNNRGRALHDLKRLDEALASFDRAISIQPNFAEAFNNRGTVLQDMRRLEEALASYDQAIALRPNYAVACSNRGNILRDLQRFDDAAASYDRAVSIKPDYAEAYRNKAFLKLLLGDFEEGWKLYEWRWKAENVNAGPRGFEQAAWLGRESLKGKTLLLHTEQGQGDTLQMLRYVPVLAALGARVVVDVLPPLASIAATVKGVSLVITPQDALPDFDMRCPFMSLPLALNTHIQTIPSAVPYLFAPEKSQSVWRDHLGEKSKPRIGLVWAGASIYPNDQNRSIALQALLPLLDLDAEFYSLQKDYREADRAVMQSDRRIRDCSGMLHDFGDTAGLIAQLDLVISVDTSVAHLAGALGKPVWILLPFAPDFRWLLERTDSPWYPTARLFRQAKARDWDAVIRQIGVALGVLLQAQTQSLLP